VVSATRVVTDSMIGLQMPNAAVWSPRVSVVLGQNPGMFTGPGTNTYLVGTGRRPLLLDTGQGVEAYASTLETAVRETRPSDGIDAIVLTHDHPDHVGGVEQVEKIFGRHRVLKMMPVGRARPAQIPADAAITPLADGDVVETEGARLRAYWTPGHARDHLCFYLEEERALFTGDVVLGAGTTVIPDDGDLGDYLASLRRLVALDLDVIFPAHGPAIRNPREKITQYLDHRALRDRQILEGLRAGLTTVEALVASIYADIPQMLHFAAGMSVRAHLRKLEREGLVTRDGEAWRPA
jgi:glyoxylase-like metal-dependent hydrolase (beta-lactamase superfamily II)